MTWPQPIRGLLPRNKNLVGGKQRVRFTQNFSVLQPSWGLAQRGGAAVSPNRQPAPGVGSGLFSRLAPRALPAAQFLLSITLRSEQKPSDTSPSLINLLESVSGVYLRTLTAKPGVTGP